MPYILKIASLDPLYTYVTCKEKDDYILISLFATFTPSI